MRFLFTLLIASTVVVLHALDNPGRFGRWFDAASGMTHDTLWTKDIRIEGLKTLSRTEVERVLPLDHSVAWWRANLPAVQARIAENPWIDEVTVVACPDTGVVSSWGCFLVQIEEREPVFVTSVDDNRWLVSHDGTFLRPVFSAGEEPVDLEQLVVVNGLASRAASPDLVRAQLALALDAKTTLEHEVGRKVKNLVFEGKGDIAVRFEGLGFMTIFAAAADSDVSLVEQAVRCRHLLNKVGHRLAEIEKIDLAFSRVGIVKFRAQS